MASLRDDYFDDYFGDGFQPSVPMPDAKFYQDHSVHCRLREEQIAEGLRLTNDEYQMAKSILKRAYHDINPENESYSGNLGRKFKRMHADRCLEKYPFLGHGDLEWTRKGLPIFMKRHARNVSSVHAHREPKPKSVSVIEIVDSDEEHKPRRKGKHERQLDAHDCESDDESDDGQPQSKAYPPKGRDRDGILPKDKHQKEEHHKEELRKYEKKDKMTNSGTSDHDELPNDHLSQLLPSVEIQDNPDNAFNLTTLPESIPRAPPTPNPTVEEVKTLRFFGQGTSRTPYVDTNHLSNDDWYNSIKEEMMAHELVTLGHKDIYIYDGDGGEFPCRTHRQVATAVAKVKSYVVHVYAKDQPHLRRPTRTTTQETSMHDPQKRVRSLSTEEEWRLTTKRNRTKRK